MPLSAISLFVAASCVFLSTAVNADTNGSRSEIAFGAEHGGGLHTVEVSTGRIHEVHVGMDDVHDLAYNVKEQALVFSAGRTHGSPESLYLYWRLTGKLQRIFNGGSRGYALYRPQFDPSGRYIYALNYDEGIFRYSLQAQRWEPIAIVGKSGINPQGVSFSRSGTKVAISHGRFNGFLIASTTPDGLHIEQEILKDFDSCTSPRWLGDDAIVFAGRKKPGLQFLWKYSLASGQLEQLTASPIGARDFLSLSRDEKTVVFTASSVDQPLEWRLWLLALGSPPPKQLTKGGKLSGHLFPVWLE